MDQETPSTSMEGRWGRRVYGKVVRQSTYTRFRLEFVLRNEVTIHETHILPNDQVDQYPKLYGWTLDMLFERLKTRVEARLQ
jgi:hypothetical protein